MGGPLRKSFGWSDILDTADSLSLEFAVVELLDGVAEVVGSLVLNESGLVSSLRSPLMMGEWRCLPTAITLTANLGVDDVQSRLAGEVLQVL